MNEMHLHEIEDDFMQLVEERRETGEKEYGAFKFLEKDTFEMAYEELADFANYALFTFIKLRLLEERINSAIRTDRATLDVRDDS